MVPSMAISSEGGQGFAQPELTEELKRLRRVAFGTLFGKERVGKSTVELENEAGFLVDHLVWETGRYGSVEIRPALRRCVTNFVLRYVFSVRVPFGSESRGSDRYTPQLRVFEELVDVTDRIWTVLTSTQTTMADLLAPPGVTEKSSFALRRLVQRRDRILRNIVATRRRERHQQQQQQQQHGDNIGQSRYDMLDALLDAKLTDDEVHYTLVDLFVAGVNTVSTTLEWFLLLLADNPTQQKCARGSNDHTRAVVKEVLRFKPPLLLPRTAVVDSTVGGYDVPAGTTVLVNNWALTHGKEWWTSPQRFRPERWLEEESGSMTGADACRFIPYSIGRRVCPGSRLAEKEMAVATEVLLGKVRWTKEEGGT